MYFYTSMGCRKLSYYQQGRALGVNPIFFTPAVEKNGAGSKNCLNSSRYGFQGQEKDDEWTGISGSHLNYKFRVYDARIARFFAVDPLTKDYPWNSPYAFSENDVIRAVELEGLEKLIVSQTAQKMFTKIKKISSVDVELQRILIDEISKENLKDKIHIYIGVSSTLEGSNGTTPPENNIIEEAKWLVAAKSNPSYKAYYPDQHEKLTRKFEEMGANADEILKNEDKGIRSFFIILDNSEEIKQIKTYAHEVELHLKGAIKKDGTSVGKDHIRGYGKEAYRKLSAFFTPPEKDTDPNSLMGKIYTRINNAFKKTDK